MMADESHLEFFFPFNHLDDSSFNLALYEISHGPLNFISINTQVIIQNRALSLARYLGLSADNHLDGQNGRQ